MKASHALRLVLVGIFLNSGTALVASQTQAVYGQHCAMCHGQDGKADTPVGKAVKAPDLLSPLVQKKTDAELTEIIENGKQKMPSFKAKLKPEQVRDLVAYIRKLAKPDTTKQK